MRVLFKNVWGPYWPGADPILDDAQAARLIEGGFCEPMGTTAINAKKPKTEGTNGGSGATDNDDQQDGRSSSVSSRGKGRAANKRE